MWKVKVKWSHYRPGVAQRVGRGIALFLHDRGTRRGWVVSSTPRQHFTPGKDLVPIVQEAGWAPGPAWTGGNLVPTGIWPRTVQPVVSNYSHVLSLKQARPLQKVRTPQDSKAAGWQVILFTTQPSPEETEV